MLKYKILIKLFVLNCMTTLLYCVHNDTTLADGHNKLPKHVEGYAVYSTINLYMHLLVLFLIMDHQCMVMNLLTFTFNSVS